MDEFEIRAQQLEKEFQVGEVKIYTETGGYIAGKFWGNKSVRPFVCLHGWLNNAGTFDRLIPLLPKEYSYLAIDFPGHGKSSRLPKGVPYHNLDYVYLLVSLMKEYNWNKISIIGHSLGTFVGFLFASIYPEKVDMLISIEGIKPVVYSADMFLASVKDFVENFPLADQRNQEGVEKALTYEEAIEKICEHTQNSVTREAAPYLLRRGLVPSKKYPGKYCFSIDDRQKYNFGFYLGHEIYIMLSKKINMPFLVIKAANFPSLENSEYLEETISTLRKVNKDFIYHAAESSSHHLHLSEPEKISGVISNFIKNYKKVSSHL